MEVLLLEKVEQVHLARGRLRVFHLQSIGVLIQLE